MKNDTKEMLEHAKAQLQHAIENSKISPHFLESIRMWASVLSALVQLAELETKEDKNV